MAKVLILTGDAGESLEVMYPYQRLLEEGYEVDIAAPSKKKLQCVVHDFVEGFDIYTKKPGYTWDVDLAFADVDPGQYVALVVPGGRAPETSATTPTASASSKSSSPTRSPSPSSATRRSCSARPASCRDGARRLPGARAGRRGLRGRRWRRGWPDGLRPRLADNPAWMRAVMRVLKERAPAEGAEHAASVS